MVIDTVEIRISCIVYAQPILDQHIQTWAQSKQKEAIMLWTTGQLVNMAQEHQVLEQEGRVRDI